MTRALAGLSPTKSKLLSWMCLVAATHVACLPEDESGDDGNASVGGTVHGSGGVFGSGGTTGGASSGGAGVGGTSSGGVTGTGAAASTGGFTNTGGTLGTGSATSTGGASTGGAGSGGTSSGGAAAGGSGGTSHTGTWKIMPFGDSITGSGCWRAKLQTKLQASGFTDVDFVGTRNGPSGCGVASYDMNNEGHGGYIGSDILKNAGTGVRPGGADSSDPYVSDSRDLETWFNGSSPDILLMHWGTNDVWNNIAPATILQAYSAVLAKVRSRNPSVIVLVAQIIPMNPSGCGECNSRVSALNAQIPGWATQNSTAASPVTVVDQNQGFNVSWTSDGVHPNANEGSEAIADKWSVALSSILSSIL